ncbi:BTB/POZ domain-containing protein 1-like [Mercenaria mercenaria]|uniref:BTB/POZ domain-containing protein 1-like n=1 Tax=Mercenaria mercenaria TaxID=6596 RepID=UPI00234EDF3D|nr:BTB/POZ domain-containing protein 1-like [Mercenaria mercenaria]
MEGVDDKNDARQGMGKQLSEDWQQGRYLVSCMKEMYDRSLWTDVKFHCKDHEEEETIQAHKIVLAARSPVFQAMFYGPCADGKDEFELKDTEKDIFLLLLRYIYSDTVTLREENAFALLEMAHFYQVSSLVQFCADYLATVITSDNACETLTFATFYKLTSLKDTCCSFIDNHAEQVLQSEGFMNLSDDSLLYILKGDTLYAKEEDILGAAEKWSKNKAKGSGMEENGTNIRKLLGDSFYYLRLPTMTSKALLEYTSRKGYFSIEEYADISAFVNNVPDIYVSTNSCVARVPEKETVLVNPQDGELGPSNSIGISFKVSVSRNVLLLGFVLGEISPYLKNTKSIYTQEGPESHFPRHFVKELRFGENLGTFEYDSYANKAVKFTTLDRPRKRNYYITELEKLDAFALPENLRLDLSGSISINGLDCRQTIELQQLQLEGGEVKLNQPILLEKVKSPCIVNFNLCYSGNSDLQMKARCCKSKESIYSETGCIQIHNIHGSFAGIRMIRFMNYSNRERQDTDPTACVGL